MAALIDVPSVGMLGVFGLAGHWEIIIILLAILLLFGGKKLPELARGLARGLRSFKDELKGVKTDIEEVGRDVREIDDSPLSEDRPEQQAQTKEQPSQPPKF